MKVRRIITLFAFAIIAITTTAGAKPMDGFDFYDSERDQIIKVTTINNDIVRVDVVPSNWKGKPLPSLAKEQSYDANFTYNNGNIFDELVTNSGLRVITDKSLNTVIVCNKNTLFTRLRNLLR